MAGKRVVVSDLWEVTIPEGFIYSTDKKIIGSHRNIIIIEDKTENEFDESFAATISFTSHEQDTKGQGIHVAHQMFNMFSSGDETVIRDNDRMFIAYSYLGKDKEDDSTLDKFLLYVATRSKLSSIQVFFNDSKLSLAKQTDLVEKVARSIVPVIKKGYKEKNGLEVLSFSKGKEVTIDNRFIIPIPDGFHYSTDPRVIGNQMKIVVFPEKYGLSNDPLEAPFGLYVFPMEIDTGDNFKEEWCDAINGILTEQVPIFQNTIAIEKLEARKGLGIFTQAYYGTPDTSWNKIYAAVFAKNKLNAISVIYNHPGVDGSKEVVSEFFWNVTYDWLERIRLKGEKKKEPVVKETPENKLGRAVPDKSLYPHYGHILDTANMGSGLGATVVVNASGTEYQLCSFDDLLKDMNENDGYDDEGKVNQEAKKLVEKCINNNPSGYVLDKTAEEMIGLFHVNESIFDMRHDREAELQEGYIRKAYMMNALRSFAWTLADYCKENKTTPKKIEKTLPSEIAKYVESRKWLNYDGETHCKGLCSNSDLHVYYIPDSIPKTESKIFLPSKKELDDYKKMKEQFPGYSPIFAQVGSLDKLRKDLDYIYPAIQILYDKLSENRDTNKPLDGAEADIVYAWIALAKAAKLPFYTEDGPSGYMLSQPTTDKEFSDRFSVENKKQKKNENTSSNINFTFATKPVPDNRKKLIDGNKKEEYAVRFAPTSTYLKDGEIFNATFIHYCRKYNPEFFRNTDTISSAAERYIGVFGEDEQTDIRYGYLKTTLPIHALRSFVWTAVETQPANKRKSFPENLTMETLAEMSAFIRDKGFANYDTMKKTVARYGALLLPSEEVRREYSLFNPLIRSLNNLNDWKLINREYYGTIARAGSADLSQFAILMSELIKPMDVLYSIVASDSYDDYTKEAAKEIIKGWCLFAFACKQPFFSMYTKEFPVESVKGETVNSIDYEPEFETIDEGRYTLFKGCVIECNDKRKNAIIPEGVIDFAPVSYNRGYMHYFDSSETVTYPETYRGDILMTEGVKEIVVNSNCDVLRFNKSILSRSEDFKLETLIINGKIKELDGYYGLNHLYNLKKLVLPNSLVKIDGITYNENLKNITLPEGLKEIGPEALSFGGIQTITIPSSVEIIGEGAFDYYSFTEKSMTIRAYKGSYGFEWAKKFQKEKGNVVKIIELEPVWMEKAKSFFSKISTEYFSSENTDDIQARINSIIDSTLANNDNYVKGRSQIISSISSDELSMLKKTVEECETIDELRDKLPNLLAEDIPKVKKAKEIKKAKNQITDKKLEISRFEKEVEEKEEKIADYEKQIEGKERILSDKINSLGYDLEEKKAQMSADINDQAAIITGLEAKIKVTKEAIEYTTEELNNAGLFKFSLKKELNAKIESLNSELEALEEKMEGEKSKYAELSEELSEKVTKPSNELDRIKNNISSIMYTMKQVAISLDTARNTIEKYRNEIPELEAKLKELEGNY